MNKCKYYIDIAAKRLFSSPVYYNLQKLDLVMIFALGVSANSSQDAKSLCVIVYL